MVSIGRDFKDAKALLAKLRASRSRKLSQYPIALPHGTTTLRGTPHLHKIKGWLNKLGHTDRDLDKLKVIHIAGTKGKGSTCAYIESMLLAHGARTGFPKRVGLYTSPHLIEYTERIRLNANPISETKFAENLFEIWDCLGDGPRSLQLLALLSFHTFIKEGVDVAIYEAHHGGEYDVTNVVNQPAVTATTTIGLDHIDELGPTIENIAWHKGGIFKTGAPALSSPQVLEVSKILKCRAAAKGTSLRFIQADLEDIPVPVQRVNASLAREACREFLYRQVGHILSEEDIQAGIRNFAWPGRFQTEQKNGVIWCLDGAHNPMSGLHTAAWFNSISHSSVGKHLLFGLDSDRHDGLGTLKSLSTIKGLSSVTFTSDTNVMNTSRIEEYEAAWKTTFPYGKTRIAPVNKAMEEIYKDEQVSYVLVTGSLYLVGMVLARLQQD